MAGSRSSWPWPKANSFGISARPSAGARRTRKPGRRWRGEETESNGAAIRTVNLKSDLPSVQEALQRLGREIALAKKEKILLLKVIHGYGSSGAGGEIRIAVQRQLREVAENGQIRQCIFGEDWSTSNEETWRLLQTHAELKRDADLGRRNLGITIVLL